MSNLNQPIRTAARSRLAQLALFASATAAVFALAGPGQAQPTPAPTTMPTVTIAPAEATPMTGDQLWAEGGCGNCHGNLAAGDGDPAYPAGPNLRAWVSGRELLVETISCGRPSTPMPFNLAGAYTETPCYGIPLGPPPGVSEGANFTHDEIETLADFLMTNVVGVTRITKEACAAFYGGNVNAIGCREF